MLSKSDLARKVAEKTKMPISKATDLVNAVIDSITETMARGEEIRITGFGTFRIAHRGERTARNPRTGETIRVPATQRPAFTPGSSLVEAVRSSKKRKAA